MFLVGSSSCFKHTNYISGVKYNPVGFGRFPTILLFLEICEKRKNCCKRTSNLSLGCLERWKFPWIIIEGLQYGFGQLYWRTKPRGVWNDFFCIFLKTFPTKKV